MCPVMPSIMCKIMSVSNACNKQICKIQFSVLFFDELIALRQSPQVGYSSKACAHS